MDETTPQPTPHDPPTLDPTPAQPADPPPPGHTYDAATGQLRKLTAREIGNLNLQKRKPWQPGCTGNPRGRGRLPSPGKMMLIHFTDLQEYPEARLRELARDKTAKPAKRAAALLWLDILAGATEIDDVEPYLEGHASLQKLRGNGVNLRGVVEVSRDADGRAKVKFSDSGRKALAEALDRTVGRPSQQVHIRHELAMTAEQLVLEARRNAGLPELTVEATSRPALPAPGDDDDATVGEDDATGADWDAVSGDAAGLDDATDATEGDDTQEDDNQGDQERRA